MDELGRQAGAGEKPLLSELNNFSPSILLSTEKGNSWEFLGFNYEINLSRISGSLIS